MTMQATTYARRARWALVAAVAALSLPRSDRD